jgi:hypothetical protein
LTECLGFSQTEVISPKVVPELQHWFYDFVINSVVTKYVVPAPVDIDTQWMPQRSFIELLFNEQYPYNSYEYRYKQNTNNSGWPSCVRTRIMIYGAAADYLVLDPTGDNVFLLQQDDFTMLDALLAYRQDSTGVTMIDTTAGVTVFDSTSGVLTVYYDGLSTPLSKLIYLYLKLMIYSDISRYNNLTVISRTDTNPTYIVLENMYELFLIDKYFTAVSNRYVRNVGGCDL